MGYDRRILAAIRVGVAGSSWKRTNCDTTSCSWKVACSIGDIIVSFAVLENTTQALAGLFIAEHQRIGQIITAELPFRNLRALTVNLYRERRGEDEDFHTLQALMKQAADLEEKRNQIAHSVWGAGGVVDTVTRIKMTA